MNEHQDESLELLVGVIAFLLLGVAAIAFHAIVMEPKILLFILGVLVSVKILGKVAIKVWRWMDP